MATHEGRPRPVCPGPAAGPWLQRGQRGGWCGHLEWLDFEFKVWLKAEFATQKAWSSEDKIYISSYPYWNNQPENFTWAGGVIFQRVHIGHVDPLLTVLNKLNLAPGLRAVGWVDNKDCSKLQQNVAVIVFRSKLKGRRKYQGSLWNVLKLGEATTKLQESGKITSWQILRASCRVIESLYLYILYYFVNSN